MTPQNDASRVDSEGQSKARVELTNLIYLGGLVKPAFQGEDLSKSYPQHNIWVVNKVMNTTYWVSRLDSPHFERAYWRPQDERWRLCRDYQHPGQAWDEQAGQR